MTAPALALLAGGGSTRMGRDKAGLAHGGTTLLAHLVGLGAALGLRVLVCGRTRPADWSGPVARFLPDATPGEGPLRGLEAALAMADDVLLVACDLPRLTTAELAWLLAQAPGPCGTACLRGGRVEPLFSRYTAGCRPALAEELAAGRRSPQGLIARGGFARVEAPPEVAARLDDADTPEDWQRLARS